MVWLRASLTVVVLVVVASSFRAVSAQGVAPREHPAEDTERVVVRLVDLAGAPEGIDSSGPPFLMEGRQPASLTRLREWLWAFAAPRRFPDTTLAKDFGRVGSRRIVRIEADPLADAAWVLALLQLSSRIPGNDGASELVASPLVTRFELGLIGTNEQVAFRLRTEQGTTSVATKHFRLVTTVAERFQNVPSEDRVVALFPATEPAYGEVRGLAPLSLSPARFGLMLEPRQTFLRLRAHLAIAHERGESVCLQVDGKTPVTVLYEIVQALVSEGHREFGIEGTSSSLMRELEAGRYASKLGNASLAYTPPAARFGPIVSGEIEDFSEIIESEQPAEETPLPTTDATTDPEIIEAPQRRRAGVGRDRRRSGSVDGAVRSGLAWLVAAQRMDGGWPSTLGLNDRDVAPLPHNDVGVSGLALLALLGAGHTDETGSNKIAVRDGLEWLRSQQDRDGAFGPRAAPGFMYGQAIATLAFCEAYGSTGSAAWRDVAQNGVRFIESARNPYCAWRYGVRPGDNDVSVTTWMLMALSSARAREIPVDVRGFKEAQRFVDEMTDPVTGRTGYQRRGELPVRAAERLTTYPASESEAVTAMAIMARLFCGESETESAPIKKAALLLRQCVPTPETGIAGRDHIYWYFGTLAASRVGGETWKEWQAGFLSTVAPLQRSDGAWPAIGAWASFGGEVYTTALMTLAIEVESGYKRVAGAR